MANYDTQKWFELYKTALLELQRAALTGRIADARAEITTRSETLQEHPDLHQTNCLPFKMPSATCVYWSKSWGNRSTRLKNNIDIHQSSLKLKIKIRTGYALGMTTTPEGSSLTTRMTKAYLSEQLRKKNGEKPCIEFTFDPDRHLAGLFTKQEAEENCQSLNASGTKIVSLGKTKHIYCKEFKVEEITPGMFVIFCMVPWEPGS